MNKELKVFTFNQIVGYIETSVDKGLSIIQSIQRQANEKRLE